MATYYDLPYTGAEVAADLAKVHDKESLVEEAPTDGNEYVRKDGAWVDLGLGDLSSVIDMANGEIVKVGLSTNQSAGIDLTGITIHALYGSVDHIYNMSGEHTIIVLPKDTACTVSVVGNIDGYKTPDAVTFTSVENGTRSIEFEYEAEAVSVTLSVSNITKMTASGLNVTINETAYPYNGSAITAMVPFGTTYTIGVDGGAVYTTPEASVYTAETSSRAVEISVSVNTGVYIQDADGGLYTADTWDTANNDNANGVAVILEECQFVLLPNEPQSLAWASSASVNISSINFTSASTAQGDYDGKSNTSYLSENTYTSGTSYAAGYCLSVTSKRGKTGYLGAAGELYKIYENKAAINELLSLIGGTTIGSQNMWSSCQYYSSSRRYYAWCVYMYNGSVSSISQTTSRSVVVLTEL